MANTNLRQRVLSLEASTGVSYRKLLKKMNLQELSTVFEKGKMALLDKFDEMTLKELEDERAWLLSNKLHSEDSNRYFVELIIDPYIKHREGQN